jgi:elongation factor P
MTIEAGDLRKGLTIELDGEPYAVVEYDRMKMQQRAPVTRVRFRSLRTGKVLDRSFSGYDVKLKPAPVERREAQYLYSDGDMYHFMDIKSFEQFPLSRDRVGEATNYLVEQTTVQLVFYKDEAITIDLPITVDLKVTETEPGFKGDTATGGGKPATLETGLQIQVPLFVSTGDTVRVDTRNGQYVSRV